MTRGFVKQMLTDPQSNEVSASRVCLCALILVFLPALTVLEAFGVKVSVVSIMGVCVTAVCGVYAANSALRVWRNKVHDKEK